MRKIRLGRTGLLVSKTAFGALPIQRVDQETAAQILRRAYDAGINFFDSAHGYSDSEEKIGYALSDVRDRIILATKAPSQTRDGAWREIETSLKRMKTGYIDLDPAAQTHRSVRIRRIETARMPLCSGLKSRGLSDISASPYHRTDVARRRRFGPLLY
jgi:aryl-alcohol dehydrogenase-like predicted oxidoreductase